MWLTGQVAKMEGSRVGREEEEEVGAGRYMRKKLRMEVRMRKQISVCDHIFESHRLARSLISRARI